MNCPDCSSPREHIIRSADEMYVPTEMRPAGLFAWVLRCWECGRNESGYTTLTFRPVTIDDTQLLYNWRNDPETREHSFNQHPLEHTQHEMWVKINLTVFANQTSVLWLIGMIGDTPVGSILINLFSDPMEINIMVAPEFRGSGLGTAMLALAPIPAGTRGRVKGTNPASVWAFYRAGWKMQEIVYVK